ncbi:hypothetical protein J1614_003286 [Plenodomus biglobosus]|nr:hypothetical protein J1614_003286 [Plenodomus biglobosus]
MIEIQVGTDPKHTDLSLFKTVFSVRDLKENKPRTWMYWTSDICGGLVRVEKRAREDPKMDIIKGGSETQRADQEMLISLEEQSNVKGSNG